MRIALDTNFLVYAEGFNDLARRDAARDIVRRLPRGDTFLPIQVLGELFNVLTRKARREADAARVSILGWRDTFATIETSSEVLLAAMDLAADHQLVIWDAIILSTAAEANCRLLLSEDMQDGFTWRGVSVTNPFAATRHPLLDAMLNEANI
jgi:predicted nucleic acid-binding protein